MKLNEQLCKILKVLIKNKVSVIKGRPLSFNLDHYIDIIFKVLVTGCQWNSLNENLHYTVYF